MSSFKLLTELAVLAQTLLAVFRTRLGPGYATATPDTLQRRFLDSPGTITINGDQITVRIDRRTYSPALRQATLPRTPPSPGGTTAACTSSSANPGPKKLR